MTSQENGVKCSSRAGSHIKRALLFWIAGARGNPALSDPGIPDQHQGSQTHPPFPVGPQVSMSQVLSNRLHLGWFNHINNQINSNELNPINSNRANRVINFCRGSWMTTLFIKYHQGKKMCLQNFLKAMLVLIIWKLFFSFENPLQWCCWLPCSFLESKTLMTGVWRKLSYFNLTIAICEIQDVI